MRILFIYPSTDSQVGFNYGVAHMLNREDAVDRHLVESSVIEYSEGLDVLLSPAVAEADKNYSVQKAQYDAQVNRQADDEAGRYQVLHPAVNQQDCHHGEYKSISLGNSIWCYVLLEKRLRQKKYSLMLQSFMRFHHMVSIAQKNC